MFTESKHTPHTLAKLTLLFALFVVMLGAYTRLSDSGLGCPDWPGCYGQVLVPDSSSELTKAQELYPDAPLEAKKAWIEMIHRYCAGALGLMILALFIMAWRRRSDRTVPLTLSFLVLLMVIFQAMLGMWTVTLSLLPVIVLGHLMGGMTVVALLFCLVKAWGVYADGSQSSASPKLKRFALLGLLIVVLQIFLGGWTSSNYATWACADFPTCHGEWLPDLKLKEAFDFSAPVGPNYLGGVLDHPVRVTIHWAHRLGALITLLIVGYLSWLLISERYGHFRTYGYLLGFVLILQLLIGVGNIVLHFPLWNAVLHNGMAAVLLMVLVGLNYKMYYARNQYLN